jgi:hypothetical protein
MKNIFLHAQFCASQKEIYYLPDNLIVLSLPLVEATIHCSCTASQKILKHKNARTDIKIGNRAYVDIKIGNRAYVDIKIGNRAYIDIRILTKMTRVIS